MVKMVRNGKALSGALVAFILENVTGHRTSFEVSDIKGDGTVFVKFRSSPVDSASELVERFCEALEDTDHLYMQTAECQVRLAVAQFSSCSV